MPPKGYKKNLGVSAIPNRRGKGIHSGTGFTAPMGGAGKSSIRKIKKMGK